MTDKLTDQQIKDHCKWLGLGATSDPEFVRKLCDMALERNALAVKVAALEEDVEHLVDALWDGE